MSSDPAASPATTDAAVQPPPRLSILVVNYNSWGVCAAALRSLLDHPPSVPFEVVVVDNASPQRNPQAEQRVERLVGRIGGHLIRHTENGGYSTGMNLALRHAHPGSDWILVSNPDVVYQEGTVDALLEAMQADPSIGAATPQLFWDFGRTGLLPPNILPTFGDLVRQTWSSLSLAGQRAYSRWRSKEALAIWRPGGDVELDMLSGCCFLMRRDLIDRIGFFDERYPLYYEDTDLSRTVWRAGKRIVQIERSHLVHLYNKSAGNSQGEAMRRYWISRDRYYRKWEWPVGWLLYRAMRWFQSWGPGNRRATRNPVPSFTTLPPGPDKPVLELPRPCDDFLVEICLDPHFFLAAASFGEGSSWTPTDSLFGGFAPTTWWFRVVDLTDPSLPELGVWTWTRTADAPEAPPAARARAAAAAAADAEARG